MKDITDRTNRLLRGGSYVNPGWHVLLGVSIDPGERDLYLPSGFRVARTFLLHVPFTVSELSNWKDANIIQTLAAIYAESGDYKEAVKWQKRAIELGFADKEESKKASRRLKLYEEGKPCWEKR